MQREHRKIGRDVEHWLARGAGALGALLTAVLMAGAPAAGAVPSTSFPHATWTGTQGESSTGCAAAHSSTPTWDPATGVGHWRGASAASSCSAAQGGNTTYSYSASDGEIQVTDPVTLHSGAGGVNASWTLQINAGDHASTPAASSPCPVTHGSYSYFYNNSTWINVTYTSSYCTVGASVYVFALAYLYDLTNGTIFYPTVWAPSIYNTSGTSQYAATWSTTYSNSSWWSYNSSGSYYSNVSYGSSGSLSGKYTPKWSIPGTFVGTHSYELVTYVYAATYAWALGYASVHAGAHFNAKQPGTSLTLNRVHVW